MNTMLSLIEELDCIAPDWRSIYSNPIIAAAYYGINYFALKGSDNKYVALDFSNPDYRNLVDGFPTVDND